MSQGNRGELYVVATPIGNLQDITLRALEVLRSVDLIAAEDTRRTQKLLRFYKIQTPLVSYHEQGSKGRSDRIVRHILEGRRVALVSEAGTPGISDPGYELIQRCLEEGIGPIPVPGPSVLVAFLSVCGLPTHRFVFEGFLPKGASRRRRKLEEIRFDPRTLIFFESPRRLAATLEEILSVMGNRRCAVGRELTKRFEQILRGTVEELLQWAGREPPRGEVCLAVEGFTGGHTSWERVEERIAFLKERCGLGDRDVIRVIHAETGLPKKEVYRMLTR